MNSKLRNRLDMKLNTLDFNKTVNEDTLMYYEVDLPYRKGFIQVDYFNSDNTYSVLWKLESNRYINNGDRKDYLQNIIQVEKKVDEILLQL